jgi:iron(III) transport system permease protein
MTWCIVLLSFVLYPYVYLPTRAMFMMQAANLVDAARTLGTSRVALFFRVALPLARPAVAVGLSLALMEALNDIGASEFLGVRTFAVSIYSTWVTRSDLAGAAQIALAMLIVVVSLVLLERWARRQRRYAHDAQHPRPLVPYRLHGAAAVVAFVVTVIPVAVGFLVPAAYLVQAVVARVRFAGVSAAIVAEAINTLWVSLIATVIMMMCAIVVVYAVRVGRGPLPAVLARLAAVGYAVPGTVLAIGLLPVTTVLDTIADWVMGGVFGATVGLLMISSGAAMVYAYVGRFLAVTVGGVEAGFSRIPSSLDDAARTLGHGAGSVLWRVHFPLTRPALATAALLALVDCMKELPATLLLRPIGFETLATHLYGEAVRGTYEDAAIAALAIVAIGIVPVIVLARVGHSMR